MEDAGLAESTVVMFVGDHGYQVGYLGTRVLVIIIIIPGRYLGTRHPVIGGVPLQMGEHTEWMKYNNFEISHKAPMMLHVPGLIEEVLECSL